MSKFYVTTPIYYVNDKPHIGHAYTTILADVLSRYHKTAGREVFFLTGLDEHGEKVETAAKKRNMTPQAHCDDLAPRFTELWKKLEIENTDFVRTTESRHKKVPSYLNMRSVRRAPASKHVLVQRDVAISPANSLQRVQGGRRPSGKKLLPYVRSPDNDKLLGQHLRDAPVSGESHSRLYA